jgi:hypothetical protein
VRIFDHPPKLKYPEINDLNNNTNNSSSSNSIDVEQLNNGEQLDDVFAKKRNRLSQNTTFPS